MKPVVGHTHAERLWARAIMAGKPRCAHCGKAAVEVDHIISPRDGGKREFANLQPLCRQCHRWKTDDQVRLPQ